MYQSRPDGVPSTHFIIILSFLILEFSNFLNRGYMTILVVHIEQINGMTDRVPVEHTFLYEYGG